MGREAETSKPTPAASSSSSPSWVEAIISAGPPGPPQAQMTHPGRSEINDPHAVLSRTRCDYQELAAAHAAECELRGRGGVKRISAETGEKPVTNRAELQIEMRCDVSVLNLSLQMRRGAAREPLAQLLLISRLLLSSDMLSSDVASR
ncbi:hypothetical protein ABVT39_006711 [Epinephelus coioides]